MADAATAGCALSLLQAELLLRYTRLLLKWNQTYNLTAVRDPAAAYVQHLLDCLAAVPPLLRVTRGAFARVLDVGSGGGLPGFVIAVSCPHLHVICVDAVAKKTAFVRQAAAEMHVVNLESVQSRIERQSGVLYDVITARAFASLSGLVSSTASLLKPNGVWMAMKGARPDEEIAAVPANVEVFHVEPLSVPRLAAHRCLVWMRHANP